MCWGDSPSTPNNYFQTPDKLTQTWKQTDKSYLRFAFVNSKIVQSESQEEIIAEIENNFKGCFFSINLNILQTFLHVFTSFSSNPPRCYSEGTICSCCCLVALQHLAGWFWKDSFKGQLWKYNFQKTNLTQPCNQNCVWKRHLHAKVQT